MTMRSLLLALLVLGAALAGCMGTDTAPVGPAEDDGDEQNAGMDGTAGRTLLRPTPEAYGATVWANGSFAPTEACNTGGCVTGDYRQEIDLSSHIQPDVPVRIQAALDYGRDPIVAFGGPRLFVVSEDATFYRYVMVGGSDRQEVDALLKPGAKVSVVVEDYWPRTSETETAYTVSAQITIANESVPARVPVAVTLEEGQWIRGEVGDDVTFVTHYGPDDVLRGRYTPQDGVVDIQADMAGEHILLGGPSGELRLLTNGTTTELRALHLAREFADPRAPDTSGPTEWSFDAEDGVLTAGLYLRATPTHGAWVHTLDEGLTLNSPNGVVIDTAYSCTICLSIVPGAYVFVAESSAGHPGVVAGTYTGRYDWSGSYGLEVGHFTSGYVR